MCFEINKSVKWVKKLNFLYSLHSLHAKTLRFVNQNLEEFKDSV